MAKKLNEEKTKLDLNEEFVCAQELMESDVPFLFITGRAGTGKSTLLSHFRLHTKKRCAYLAPTGVAALNVNGETIHSFFRFTPGISLVDARRMAAKADKDLYKKIDALVIDEISMVRADLLDCVDVFLRRVMNISEPFGGKQVIAIGDLYQLPPVVTSWESDAFSECYETPYFFSSDAVRELADAHQIQF
ncbi:MAG: AAA family ATPase, partial [Patescibacteria group bacterium]